MKTLIFFLGPQGSGKGTQAEILEKELGIPAISTGAIFRDNINKKTELGKLVEANIKKGILISTEITNQMLENRLSEADTKNGYILDGYPRMIDQVEFADKKIKETLEKKGQVFIFYVDISDELALERLGGRRSCSCGEIFHIKHNPPIKEDICDKCGGKLIQREDDNDESIKKRLEMFHQKTEPILKSFDNEKYFYKIDGSLDIETIHQNIISIIKKL